MDPKLRHFRHFGGIFRNTDLIEFSKIKLIIGNFRRWGQMSKLQRYTDDLFYRKLTHYTTHRNLYHDWIINIETNHRLQLDFFTPALFAAIEVQGAQHSKEIRFFHQTNKDFESLKMRDRQKVYACEWAGVKLFRVTDESDANDAIDYLLRVCVPASRNKEWALWKLKRLHLAHQTMRNYLSYRISLDTFGPSDKETATEKLLLDKKIEECRDNANSCAKYEMVALEWEIDRVKWDSLKVRPRDDIHRKAIDWFIDRVRPPSYNLTSTQLYAESKSLGFPEWTVGAYIEMWLRESFISGPSKKKIPNGTRLLWV